MNKRRIKFQWHWKCSSCGKNWSYSQKGCKCGCETADHMNKPKKKEYKNHNSIDNVYIDGWNESCDAHEAWLPSIEELRQIIIDKDLTPSVAEDSGQVEWTVGESRKLAVAISKSMRRAK